MNVPIKIKKNKDSAMILLGNLALTKFRDAGCFQTKMAPISPKLWTRVCGFRFDIQLIALCDYAKI